jgi:hypothetical protein
VLAAILYALAWIFGARKLGGESTAEAPAPETLEPAAS